MSTAVPSTDLDTPVTGPVLRPGDPGYAAELAAFNLTHTPAPEIVVGATAPADVVAAVRWARAHGRPVAVQATGHGLSSDLFGSVTVSTRRMDGVVVDPVARTARVGAGTRWSQVIEAAAPYGLAPLSGSSSQVGVVGYTLGGGLGPLSRRYGLAADHVRRVQMVTGDGELREVTAASEPELFWAVRGGKGNFGIATELEFGLVPVASLYGGGVYFPGDAAPAVLHAWREWAPGLPEDTSTSVALLRLPPDPSLPAFLRGAFVAHLRFAHLGGRGEELLAPMRAVAPALADTVGPMPFTAVDAVHQDPVDPMPMWERGTTLRELPAEAVDAVLAAAGPEVDVPLAIAEIRLLGGAIGRAPAVPNAVSGRDGAFSVLAIGPMAGPLVEVVPAVTQAFVDGLAPWSTGRGLVNFQGAANPERVGRLWSDADRSRLLAAKRRFDPENLFRFGSALA